MGIKKNIELFNKKGYFLIKNVLDAELASLINLYTLFEEKNNFSPETQQVIGAHSKAGDPLMESLLLHIQPLIEENTGLSLFPTYSFYRVYRAGHSLAPHKDRPSCEISATLCLGYNYKTDSKGSWPIFIENKKFSMNPGDMIVYKGTELTHYRNPFKAQPGEYHSQVFLHYVDQHGPYADYKFDKRDGIGTYK